MTAPPSGWPQPSDATERTLTLEQLHLNLRRNGGEYRLDYWYAEPGGSEENRENDEQPDTDRITAAGQSHRYLLGEDAGAIAITPHLADRAVVSRPQVATELLPRERVTLLVSTVLWARMSIGERRLIELPTMRLSDTWFGPDTCQGELCYASRTRARLALHDIENPLRALTPVTIINRGNDNLLLERINVPVVNLTLYSNGRQFWTSALTVAREGGIAPAKVQIETGAPAPASRAVAVSPPRRPLRDGVFDRAVNLMFA